MLDHHPAIAFQLEFDLVVLQVSDEGAYPELPAYYEWLETLRGVEYRLDRSLSYPALVRSFLRKKWDEGGQPAFAGATVHQHFDRLPFLWPEARYLYLYRDPRDVARSVVQKGWAGNVYHGSEWWLAAERCVDVLRTRVPSSQILDVRYEALVANPEEELSRICEFVGTYYSPLMLEYQDDAPQYPKPDPSLTHQWKRKMPRREVALVESRVGDALKQRGYEQSGYARRHVGRVEHELLMLGSRIKRFGQRVDTMGPQLVLMDLVGRRLKISPLEKYARRRMNAVVDAMIAEEESGKRAPSLNIPAVEPQSHDRS